MSRTLSVAALQLSFAKGDIAANISRVSQAVREAVGQGADTVFPDRRVAPAGV